VFFKTVAPVEPVSFVHKICEDAMADPMHKRTRTAKRLAPMTLMGKATMEGLEEVAKSVLAPHFHQAPVTPKKVSGEMICIVLLTRSYNIFGTT
jgi:tRNA acetyltransferase TAN1